VFLHPSSRRSRARFTINLVSRRWSGLFIVSAWGKNWNHEKRHATPRHATPRHATPRQARPGQARPGQARPKQRSGIRRGRCDDAIRASIRLLLLLFVPAASSGAERSHATPTRRVDHSQLTLSLRDRR